MKLQDVATITEGFNKAQHHENSSLREIIVEHSLIGELLRNLWRHGTTDVEILRSEFDGFGYDLVVSRDNVVRHLQLKSGTGSRPKQVGVSLRLATKPSACVLFVCVDDELNLGPYYWFGGAPGEQLQGLELLPILKRTTRNKKGEQPNRTRHRVLKPAEFTRLDNIDALIEKLLGSRVLKSD